MIDDVWWLSDDGSFFGRTSFRVFGMEGEREGEVAVCVSVAQRGGGPSRAHTLTHLAWIRKVATAGKHRTRKAPLRSLSARDPLPEKARPMAPHAARVFLKGCPPNSDWEGPKPIPAHRSTSPCTTTQKLRQRQQGTHFDHPHSSTRFQPT